MATLDEISDASREDFDARNRARDDALARTRTLVREASRAIRAVHRNEKDHARSLLAETGRLAAELGDALTGFPDLYFAGYTQDALKEYAEAALVFALVYEEGFPTATELNIPTNTFIKGLGEAATEMRRRCLDLMRQGRPEEAEPLLQQMEEIYLLLVTMDYPDAITAGLRRQTDVVRGVLERTRGDLTISLGQQHLETSLRELESRLDGAG
ncbi:MAG TPA: haloacid dehalogenase [Anaerolineales bacterium]|nr:haloacid dehalogenase [Anaerolineales bacterium]